MKIFMAANQQNRARGRSLTQLQLALLSVVVGVVAGFGAVVFRGLIALIHNGLFLGKWSVVYDANVHTPPSPWGVFVIFVPVVGAVGVAFLVKNFAPEAKGHGVPEVMDAIYYQQGRIRPVVALIKSLASALSIGSGGSVGREGPIIQIGSSFGSAVGQLLDVSAWQRIVLIACGAGGGIAATFNTPVGGLLFVLELMLHEVSARTIVPVALATVTATYVGRLYFGVNPSFVIPTLETPYFHVTRPLVLLAYAGLGTLMGGTATVFIEAIYSCEDVFEKRVKGSYYRQHILGMSLVGIMIYLLMRAFGHYYIEGVSYATIQDVLAGAKFPLSLVLLLFALKLLATSLTLGSGASGGIFSPALFLGASAGTAYGMILEGLFPGLEISPPAFAVAGMAGLVGGSTGAAMAAIVMIFEMTLDYNVILPITIVVAISYGVRKMFLQDSIYTMKLTLRGHYLPEALRTNPHLVKRAKQMMVTQVGTLSANGALDELTSAVLALPVISCFLVENDNRVVGFINRDTALQALRQDSTAVKLGEIAAQDFTTASEETTLADIIDRLHATRASIVLVTDGAGPPLSADKVKGVITKQELADAIVEAAELYLD